MWLVYQLEHHAVRIPYPYKRITLGHLPHVNHDGRLWHHLRNNTILVWYPRIFVCVYGLKFLLVWQIQFSKPSLKPTSFLPRKINRLEDVSFRKCGKSAIFKAILLFLFRELVTTLPGLLLLFFVAASEPERKTPGFPQRPSERP